MPDTIRTPAAMRVAYYHVDAATTTADGRYYATLALVDPFVVDGEDGEEVDDLTRFYRHGGPSVSFATPQLLIPGQIIAVDFDVVDARLVTAHPSHD